MIVLVLSLLTYPVLHQAQLWEPKQSLSTLIAQNLGKKSTCIYKQTSTNNKLI